MLINVYNVASVCLLLDFGDVHSNYFGIFTLRHRGFILLV